MANLIRTSGHFQEGEIFNKWLKNRLVRRNQNILVAVTGGTGSGKSYSCLEIAELWYKFHFKKDFPIKNVCFSVGEVMKLITSKELKAGELIIFEEAGVNLGSLDFQQRISKLFTYVLQSFRSMNIGILFNLPVLSMLNKSARLLIHCHVITYGIDYQNKKITLKVYFHQLNQQTGKVYPKYMRVNVKGKAIKVSKFVYSLASERLTNGYEFKKTKFVSDFSEGFSRELDVLDKDNLRKMGRKDLTERQQTVFNYLLEGMTPQEIAKEIETSVGNVYDIRSGIKRRGYLCKKGKKKAKGLGKADS